MQAALLAAGSLEPKLVARTTGRKALSAPLSDPRGGPGGGRALGIRAAWSLGADRGGLRRPDPRIALGVARAGRLRARRRPGGAGVARHDSAGDAAPELAGRGRCPDRQGPQGHLEGGRDARARRGRGLRAQQDHGAVLGAGPPEPACQVPPEAARHGAQPAGRGWRRRGAAGRRAPGRQGSARTPSRWTRESRSRSTSRGRPSAASTRSGTGRSAATATTGARSPSTTRVRRRRTRISTPARTGASVASWPGSGSRMSGTAVRTRATCSTSPR